LLPPTIYAVCAARRGERLGSFGAEHAEPDNMYTLAAVIEAPTRRAESAIWLYRLHGKGCAQLPLRRKRAG
jgi:hypothetical protein